MLLFFRGYRPRAVPSRSSTIRHHWTVKLPIKSTESRVASLRVCDNFDTSPALVDRHSYTRDRARHFTRHSRHTFLGTLAHFMHAERTKRAIERGARSPRNDAPSKLSWRPVEHAQFEMLRYRDLSNCHVNMVHDAPFINEISGISSLLPSSFVILIGVNSCIITYVNVGRVKCAQHFGKLFETKRLRNGGRWSMRSSKYEDTEIFKITSA